MTQSETLQVLVVEDSTLVCDRIAEIVGAVPGVAMSARLGSEADALSALERGGIAPGAAGIGKFLFFGFVIVAVVVPPAGLLNRGT